MIGLGDVLYESATIAYDTAQQEFINPQTGDIYGPTPPAGGWAISAVPTGDIVSSQALAPTPVVVPTSTSVQAISAVSPIPVVSTPVTGSDFMNGVTALFSPSSWGAVLGSGDITEIAGLLMIPALAVFMFMKKERN